MGGSGGKVVFVSGLLGVACAGVEVLAGSYGVARHIARSEAVLGLGMVGALLSAAVVGLGVAGRRRPRRWVGAASFVTALANIAVGGMFVALPMMGALAGGAMLVGGGRSMPSDQGRVVDDVAG